ncbi:hypothetical protein CEXT_810931 [Caerostris extrusa]|uniref:Uncharacterized protein n=1 Tax=Caerostris extrusa TaxID=172846 RepID=A0AAV4PA82_CAEEX|nr:hypothetical protein CEXT_810931 [Caerostris extrusa]
MEKSLANTTDCWVTLSLYVYYEAKDIDLALLCRDISLIHSLQGPDPPAEDFEPAGRVGWHIWSAWIDGRLKCSAKYHHKYSKASSQ